MSNEEITPAMFEAGNAAQHPDDCTDVREIYRAMRRALAAGTQSDETPTAAQSEGCQSGAAETAQRPTSSTQSGVR